MYGIFTSISSENNKLLTILTLLFCTAIYNAVF